MQRKTKGILLIVLPIPTLMLVMAVYAITSFIFSSLTAASDSSGAVVIIGQVINILLGLVGVAAVAGIFVGIPVGIYLLASEDGATSRKKNSGQ